MMATAQVEAKKLKRMQEKAANETKEKERNNESE